MKRPKTGEDPNGLAGKQPAGIGPAFGPALRAARLAAGKSQDEVADEAEVRQPNISGYENGRHIPSWPMGLRLILTTGLPLEHFFPPGPILAAADRLRGSRGSGERHEKPSNG